MYYNKYMKKVIINTILKVILLKKIYPV